MLCYTVSSTAISPALLLFYPTTPPHPHPHHHPTGTLSGGQRMRRYTYIDEDRVENASGVYLSINKEMLHMLGRC
jgi:hypothetical protein